SAFARAPIGDQAKMGKAIEQLLALTKMTSVKDELKKRGFEIAFGKTTIANFPGDVREIKIARPDAKPLSSKKGDTQAPPDAIAVDSLLAKEMFFGAAGYDPKDSLKAVVQPEKTLASVATVKAALEAAGKDASLVAFADPIRFFGAMSGQPPAGDPTPP